MKRLVCLLWIMTLGCASMAQMLSPAAAKFIGDFSYAATRVDLKPGAEGAQPHLRELQNALIPLIRADDATLSESFRLLDKNKSTQRLVTADLLLLLVFDIPARTNWSKPENARLRNILVPPPSATTSPFWPWLKSNGAWQLGPFTIVPGPWDASLLKRYEEFKARFQRRLMSA